jgi:N utilization substance protein B
VQEHFAKLKPSEIDYEYLKQILPLFDETIPSVRAVVNSRATTFKFDEMDLMTRVIFTMGMIEHKVLDTPKEVLINEMVELAKRYGDTTSPKLINGIAHYMFEEKEKSDLMDFVTKKK